MTATRRPAPRPKSSSTAPTCWASSRVGVRTSACGAFSSGSQRSIRGRPNASVLPEPVWAWPMTSWPSSSRGMVWAWIGVGVVMPWAFRACRDDLRKLNGSNDKMSPFGYGRGPSDKDARRGFDVEEWCECYLRGSRERDRFCRYSNQSFPWEGPPSERIQIGVYETGTLLCAIVTHRTVRQRIDGREPAFYLRQLYSSASHGSIRGRRGESARKRPEPT